jgi:ParB family transcriptional regulator, chromosome partitioning protein
MTAQPAPQIEIVPIDRITVINPRVRNKKTFNDVWQ